MRRGNPDGVYEPVGSAYSQVVASPVDEMVFVAGTVPKDDEGSLVGAGDVETQIDRTVRNLEASLSSEDASMSDVARVRTFTTDMERYLSSDALVLDGFEDGEEPASTLVEVGRLADCFDGVDAATDVTDGEEPRYLVEVDATAVLR